jgi:UPF0716 family protein affecting phage T7 exclusion
LFFSAIDVAVRKTSDKEIHMWLALAKLVGGIVAIGAGVLTACAGAGLAGDGLVETLGRPEADKGGEGLLSRKVS